MDASKRLYQNLGRFLVLLYLTLFPFGQLLRLDNVLGGINYGNLTDVLVMFTLPLYFVKNAVKPTIDTQIKYFLVVCLFSLIISFGIYRPGQIFYGSMYFIRLCSYYTFSILVYNLIKQKSLKSGFIFKSLILISFVSAIIGFYQYLIIPNLVLLKYLNWDDHLNRLVGTYFDPGFTGIILIFGTILSLYGYIRDGRKIYLFYFFILILGILLTYSRASYLALIIVLSFSIILHKMSKMKITYLLIFFSLFVLLFIPNTGSEGTNLIRTTSISARLKDYSQTIQIISKYPLFGVGFNNLCIERKVFYNYDEKSHACSGSVSSILFILATTGVIGFMGFINIIITLYKMVNINKYLIWSIILALLIHSLFTQSIFYSFVMGYLALFFASVWNLWSKADLN
jgi:hypothetical protein